MTYWEWFKRKYPGVPTTVPGTTAAGFNSPGARLAQVARYREYQADTRPKPAAAAPARAAVPVARGRKSGGSLNRLMAEYRQGVGSANEANLARRAGALGALRHAAYLSDYSIGRDARIGVAQARQSLQSRGLGGSSVLGPLASAAMDRASRTAAGVRAGSARDIAGFLERQVDAGPDLGAYTGAAQAIGESGVDMTAFLRWLRTKLAGGGFSAA